MLTTNQKSSYPFPAASTIRHEWDNALAAFEGTGLTWIRPIIQKKPLREIEAAFSWSEQLIGL